MKVKFSGLSGSWVKTMGFHCKNEFEGNFSLKVTINAKIKVTTSPGEKLKNLWTFFGIFKVVIVSLGQRAFDLEVT